MVTEPGRDPDFVSPKKRKRHYGDEAAGSSSVTNISCWWPCLCEEFGAGSRWLPGQVVFGLVTYQVELESVRDGLTLPNLLEPLSSRGNKDHRIISHEFVVVQLIWNCSNRSTTQGARPAAEFDMSLGWFNPTVQLGKAQWRLTRDIGWLCASSGSFDHVPFAWVQRGVQAATLGIEGATGFAAFYTRRAAATLRILFQK